MTTQAWISLVACAGQLALALVALRAVQKPLGLPLALFSLALFGWNIASTAYEVSRVEEWHWFDVILSPMSTPLGFHFILTFVGRRRQLRWMNLLCYSAFGILSFSSLLAFFWVPAREFAGSSLWVRLHLAGIVPMFAIASSLLR